MSLPYMEFYPKDYLAKTKHLTDEEHGVYIQILCICWTTPGCTMPADEKWTKKHFPNPLAGNILKEFFKVKRGRYVNDKLLSIFRRVNKQHLSAKKRGKLGGDAKALKNKEKVSSKATDLPVAKSKQTSSNQNHNHNSKINNKNSQETFPSGSICYSPFEKIAREFGGGWDVDKIGDAFRSWPKRNPDLSWASLLKAFASFSKTYAAQHGRPA